MTEANSFERRTAKAAHEIFSAWFAEGMKNERTAQEFCIEQTAEVVGRNNTLTVSYRVSFEILDAKVEDNEEGPTQ